MADSAVELDRADKQQELIEYSYSNKTGDIEEDGAYGIAEIARRKKQACKLIREQESLQRKVACLRFKRELDENRYLMESSRLYARNEKQRRIYAEKQRFQQRIKETDGMEYELRAYRAYSIKQQVTLTSKQRQEEIARQRAAKVRMLKRQNYHYLNQRRVNEKYRLEYARQAHDTNITVGQQHVYRRHRVEAARLQRIKQANEEELQFYEQKSQQAAAYINDLKRLEYQLEGSIASKSYSLHAIQKRQEQAAPETQYQSDRTERYTDTATLKEQIREHYLEQRQEQQQQQQYYANLRDRLDDELEAK